MGLDIFAPKAPPVVGVDISASAIKMVELSVDKKKGICLERYAVEPLTEQVIVDGAISNAEALSEAIASCYKKLGSKIRGVAAALPSSMVVMKTLSVPQGLAEHEIEDQVSYEMANQIAFSIDEASIDFIVGDEVPGGDQVTVVAAASMRQRVDERVSAIEAAGLKTIIMDSELLALIDAAHAFMDRVEIDHENRNVLLVDMGSMATQFTFMRNGEVVYSREHAFGGHQLTRDIQDRFGVTADEARRIKMGLIEKGDPAQVQEMQRAFIEAAAEEIRHAVQLFTGTTSHSSVDAVLLCGGSVLVPGIDQLVSDTLGAPTRLFNPFEGMSLAASVNEDKLGRDCTSLVVACGLAMRRFDK